MGLGLLFIAASYYKLASPGAFAHEIYNYKILPFALINPLAIVLPWLQLFCGVALITNRGAQGASLLLVLMMLTFQVALASALIRGLNISCGCFKSGGDAATWWSFARDFLVLTLAVLQLISARRYAAQRSQ
jgi:uncharacterized membrane protein YphA (DoxX/SURF4 family)